MAAEQFKLISLHETLKDIEGNPITQGGAGDDKDKEVPYSRVVFNLLNTLKPSGATESQIGFDLGQRIAENEEAGFIIMSKAEMLLMKKVLGFENGQAANLNMALSAQVNTELIVPVSEKKGR